MATMLSTSEMSYIGGGIMNPAGPGTIFAGYGPSTAKPVGTAERHLGLMVSGVAFLAQGQTFYSYVYGYGTANTERISGASYCNYMGGFYLGE